MSLVHQYWRLLHMHNVLDEGTWDENQPPREGQVTKRRKSVDRAKKKKKTRIVKSKVAELKSLTRSSPSPKRDFHVQMSPSKDQLKQYLKWTMELIHDDHTSSSMLEQVRQERDKMERSKRRPSDERVRSDEKRKQYGIKQARWRKRMVKKVNTPQMTMTQVVNTPEQARKTRWRRSKGKKKKEN